MALGSLPCMQTLDVLAEWLSWRGITFSRMDGSTNPIQRELDVRDFNADGFLSCERLPCVQGP